MNTPLPIPGRIGRVLRWTKEVALRGVLLGVLVSAPIGRAQLASLDPQPAGILGTVLAEGRNIPVSGVLVSVRPLAGGSFAGVLTDSSGHFEMRGLTPGNYEIVLQEPGYEPTRASLQLPGPKQPVELYLRVSNRLPRKSANYTVSVRELKIPGRARNAFHNGLERLEKFDAAGGRTQFARAIAEFPEYYEAYYHLGVAELRLGNDKKAADAFQKAIDLSGGRYPWAQFSLGFVLCRFGDYVEAKSVIDRGLEVDSDSAVGRVMLSIVFFGLNRLEEAEQTAREALLRNPSLASAYLALADVHGRRKEYTLQLHDLDAYLKLAPDGPDRRLIRQSREIIHRKVADTKDRN
jgi:tetratricopeptide (TPR) repeat protein